MRILFISNFYPPFELGGWEQLTEETVHHLAERGHATAVLTSRYRADEIAAKEPGVYRLLHLESDDILHYHLSSWISKGYRERQNQVVLTSVVDEFRPDILFIHSMWNLPCSLALRAEQILPERIVFYIAGNWPYVPNVHQLYWQSPAKRPWMHLPKQIAATIPLVLLRLEREKQRPAFGRVACVSEAVRQDLARYADIPLNRSRVVHNGVDTQQFSPPAGWNPGTWKGDAPAFLYAGSLIRTKGVHTAIEGFAKVARERSLDRSTLTIIGNGDPIYEEYLKRLPCELGVVGRVNFVPRVERSRMPGLLHRFDILLVPSYFEAMPRIMQEGMATGMIVVGTPNWGAQELLKNDETGLTFEPEDSDTLAYQLNRLVLDIGLRSKLSWAGRQAVIKQFGMERMINEIETYLSDVVCGANGPE